MDLNKHPLPLPDGVCSKARSSHFLAHSNLDHIFNETHRVLVSQGIFQFQVPYANSVDRTDRKFEKSPEYESLHWWIKLLFPFDTARTVLFNACSEMTITAVKRS